MIGKGCRIWIVEFEGDGGGGGIEVGFDVVGGELVGGWKGDLVGGGIVGVLIGGVVVGVEVGFWVVIWMIMEVNRVIRYNVDVIDMVLDEVIVCR